MKEPSRAILKVLFSRSKNECAFPECTQAIALADGTLVCDVCHICAASPKGKRYDPTQSDKERHGIGNLIILCPVHHRIVDTKDAFYTVELLRLIKARHEDTDQRTLSDSLVASFLTAWEKASANNVTGANEQDVSIVEHDKRLFTDSDRILSEMKLQDILAELKLEHRYTIAMVQPILQLRSHLKQTANQFLNERLSEATNRLLSAIDDLDTFISYNFFPAIVRYSDREEQAYYLYPDMDPARSRCGDEVDSVNFERYIGQLIDVANRVAVQYVEFRTEVKRILLL